MGISIVMAVILAPCISVILLGARKAREEKMSPEASKTLLVLAIMLLAGWLVLVLRWM